MGFFLTPKGNVATLLRTSFVIVLIFLFFCIRNLFEQLGTNESIRNTMDFITNESTRNVTNFVTFADIIVNALGAVVCVYFLILIFQEMKIEKAKIKEEEDMIIEKQAKIKAEEARKIVEKESAESLSYIRNNIDSIKESSKPIGGGINAQTIREKAVTSPTEFESAPADSEIIEDSSEESPEKVVAPKTGNTITIK